MIAPMRRAVQTINHAFPIRSTADIASRTVRQLETYDAAEEGVRSDLQQGRAISGEVPRVVERVEVHVRIERVPHGDGDARGASP